MSSRGIHFLLLGLLCWSACALVLGACAPAEQVTPIPSLAPTAAVTSSLAASAPVTALSPAPPGTAAPAGAVVFDSSGYPVPRLPVPTRASVRFTPPKNFGDEIALEDLLTMAKAGKVSRIEWFADTDLVRVFTVGGGVCHVKNELYKVDIPRALVAAGVPVGDGGLEIAFET